jgi:flagellar motor switch/type III secretory pathway protein FliN
MVHCYISALPMAMSTCSSIYPVIFSARLSTCIMVVAAPFQFTPNLLRPNCNLLQELANASRCCSKPRFGEAQTDLLQAGLPKSREAISVQPFTCEGGAIKPAVISLILSAEAASRLSKRSESYSVNEAPTDAAWTDRMRAAAMRVRLPARTILARSDVSFQRLLTLSPGDVLPLLLPAQIPLTVAGHIFAHGSLGEANGRAALLIEKMEKEMDQ